jgi:hypothetical protein
VTVDDQETKQKCQIAPLSAFAATKARQKIATTVFQQDDQTTELLNETVTNETGLDYDSEQGMNEEPWERKLNEEDISDVAFGSWIPNDKNLSVQGFEEKLTLLHGETITAVGEFTLTVVSGAISILGATLTPSSGSLKVTTPTTEPIAVIRSMTADGAYIILTHLIHEDESFQSLSRVSPLFDGIWRNHSQPSRKDLKSTFDIVCEPRKYWKRLTLIDTRISREARCFAL